MIPNQTIIKIFCLTYLLQNEMCQSVDNFHDEMTKSKGRTGWPQHMWALELKQESSSTTTSATFSVGQLQ